MKRWREQIGESWFPSILTWLIVIALPIACCILVRRACPSLPIALCWIIGAVLFAIFFVAAEWLWRGVRWTLMGRRNVPRVKPPNEQAADIVSRALTDEHVRYADLMHRWPTSSSSTLMVEAKILLEESMDDGNRLDQRKIRDRFRRLNYLMNALRDGL